jgi:S1-C subfamily serine protease
VNAVDLLILALVVLAVVHGIRQGFAVQVLSFGGFWGGLALGAALGPTLSRTVSSPFAKAFVSLLSLFGLAALGGGLGRQLGSRAWETIRRLRFGAVDAVLGSVIAGVATLVAVWMIALVAIASPSKELASTVGRSAIVRTLVERLPPAPAVFSRIQRLVSAAPFPQVFAQLEPKRAPVALPTNPAVQQAVAAAGPSTVRIFGLGCGGIQTGSGFVAAPGLVVTNAHVVAGIQRQTVEDRNGRRFPATPVLFDPSMDVAVLRAPRLGAAPLPILRGDAPRGTGGAVLGYPGGGPFDAEPAAVLGEFEAVGRDIYGRSLSKRAVYQLQAVVRPGNSGGPFVRQDGEVLGMVFAASTTDEETGYALTSVEVLPRIDQASRQRATADTGPCTS